MTIDTKNKPSLVEVLELHGLKSDDPNSNAFIIAPLKPSLPDETGKYRFGTMKGYRQAHDRCLDSLREKLGIEIRSSVRVEYARLGQPPYLNVILGLPDGIDFEEFKKAYIAEWKNCEWSNSVEYFENHIRHEIRFKLEAGRGQFDLGIRRALLSKKLD